MTVIDHNGIELTGHAAKQFLMDNPDYRPLFGDPITDHPTLYKAQSNPLAEYHRNLVDNMVAKQTTPIPTELYNRLNYLGLIPSTERSHNVGESDYSTKLIQPWSIWLDHDLNPFEADLIKRILRTKSTDSRKLDLTKCKHIIDELIRQLDTKEST